MNSEWLFKNVNCNGYLKRIYDGRYIEKIDGECFYMVENEKFEIECEQCGELEFLKTYYKVTEKNFKGVVVGIKAIVMTGYLVVDTDYDYYDREVVKISKQAKDTCICAIVYFANNRKRLVPLENIESEVENVN